MKKLIAFLTALLLVFSLAVTVSAAGSPQDKKEYKITHTTNLDGAESTASKVTEGETLKLTAKNDIQGYSFVKWNIKGNYSIVSGTLNSAELVILPLSDITVTEVYEEIIPEDQEPGEDEVKVTYTYNIDFLDSTFEIVKKGEELELIAPENVEGYAFLKWQIIGDYEIVSGSLTSADLVIRPLGNIEVKTIFEKIDDIEDGDVPEEDHEDGDDGKKPQKGEVNDSDTSPQTGNSIVLVLLSTFVASLAVAVTTRKLAK